MVQADQTPNTNPSGVALTRKGKRYAVQQESQPATLVDLRLPVLQDLARKLGRVENALRAYGLLEGPDENLRTAAGTVVETLIALLDVLDGDPVTRRPETTSRRSARRR